MKLKDFDYKQFLIQKGERVALGVAVALMSMMIVVSGLTTVLGGSSASSNTRDIKELAEKASNSLKNSVPPANHSELPGDIKEVELALIEPESVACQNLYFDRSSDPDHKWRRPNVLMPDEFMAEIVRGPLLKHVLEQGEDGKFKVGVLQATNNQPSETSRNKLRDDFKRYRNWDKVLGQLRGGQRPGFPGAPGIGGAGPGGPATGGGLGGLGLGRGAPAAGLGGRGPGMMAGQWGGWSRWGREMSLKMVPEDELDQPGIGRPAQAVQPMRMVVVSGAFPYRKQLEEFRRALRFDSVDALLGDPSAIPEFRGIDVQRREIPPGGEPGDWEPLDIESSVRDIRIRAVGLEPEDPELLATGVIVHPNRLVMPRPQLANHGNYAEPMLPTIIETIQTLEKGSQAELPPPPPAKSRFEGLDPWSDSQPGGIGRGGMAGGGMPGGGRGGRYGGGGGDESAGEGGGGGGGGGLGGGMNVFGKRATRGLARAGRMAGQGSPGGGSPGGGSPGGGGLGAGFIGGGGGGIGGGQMPRAGGRGSLPGAGLGAAPGGGGYGQAPTGGGGAPAFGRMLAPGAGGQVPPGQIAAQVSTARNFAPPDKCLLRFLDVTVQPGKTYEYRVKIKITNPAYGKDELAVSKEAAAEPVLVAEEWKDVTRRVGEEEAPLRVTIDNELMYYAVDEKLDQRVLPVNSERAAVQIHRWLEEVRVNPSDKNSVVPVGEWSILERLLVHRGEYIGRQEEVDVPVWRTTKDAWALAGHSDEASARAGQLRSARSKGVVVDFGMDPVKQNYSILVDFEGGAQTIMSDGKPVRDESPIEMLVLDASGKLIVHKSVTDTADQARQQRYSAWKGEVSSLKDRENGRRPGEDSMFQRGAPGRGGRRGVGPG
jgi:hypothetical protein